MASDPSGSAAGDGSADPPSVPARPAGLPARVGDPLLPGGLPQKPVPTAPAEPAPAEPAAASAAPPPVRVSVSTPSEPPGSAAPARPRTIASAVARARAHVAPRWARALVLGGATTVVVTVLLAAWQAYGPWAEAAGQSGTAAPSAPEALGESGRQVDGGGSSTAPPQAAGDGRASQAAQGVRASRQPSPTPTPAPEPSPTPSPSPRSETSPLTAVPELTAELDTSGNLFGRSVSVTVSNPGPGEASGWEVTVIVPANQSISDVSGAVHEREGDQVVFTPVPGSEPLAPGEAVSFSFRLPGAFASSPSGCTIDGRPCA